MVPVAVGLIGWPIAVVNNFVHGRYLDSLGSFVLLGLGLLFPALTFLFEIRRRPWNQPPWLDPDEDAAA